MLPDGGFPALLLLITAVSAVNVPPPTNVTVRCQNLNITVHWEYSRQEPQTKFRVNISSTGNDGEYETTDHHYDLSNFIWKSEKHYMGFNYVRVTAIQGIHQSAPVSSDSFTYYDLKAAKIKCKLDFPPVDLTVKDSKATVRFTNPLHYYEKLNKTIKQGDTTLRFRVSSNSTNYNGKVCRDHICEQVIPSEEDVNCVKLNGELFNGRGEAYVPFRETEQICANQVQSSDKAKLDVYVLTLIILLAIFVLIIIVVALLICKEKAYALTERLPKPLVWPPEHRPILNQPPEEDPSVFELVIDPRPKKCSSEEEIDHYGSLQGDSSAASDLQPSASSLYMEGGHLDSGNEDLGAAGRLMSEGQGTDDDSVKTECLSLHSEVEERSPYDCPHAHMDMGDGDIVICYNK